MLNFADELLIASLHISVYWLSGYWKMPDMDGLEKMPKQEQATKVGELIAEKAKAAGVEAVVFDRNGRTKQD